VTFLCSSTIASARGRCCFHLSARPGAQSCSVVASASLAYSSLPLLCLGLSVRLRGCRRLGGLRRPSHGRSTSQYSSPPSPSPRIAIRLPLRAPDTATNPSPPAACRDRLPDRLSSRLLPDQRRKAPRFMTLSMTRRSGPLSRLISMYRLSLTVMIVGSNPSCSLFSHRNPSTAETNCSPYLWMSKCKAIPPSRLKFHSRMRDLYSVKPSTKRRLS
jgi:hypothetical protein